MKAMTHTDIVNKLIGDIQPHGDSNRDEKTFQNLKDLCELVDDLVTAIDAVAYNNRDSKEHSVKRSADYARDFIDNTLGIKD